MSYWASERLKYCSGMSHLYYHLHYKYLTGKRASDLPGLQIEWCRCPWWSMYRLMNNMGKPKTVVTWHRKREQKPRMRWSGMPKPATLLKSKQQHHNNIIIQKCAGIGRIEIATFLRSLVRVTTKMAGSSFCVGSMYTMQLLEYGHSLRR